MRGIVLLLLLSLLPLHEAQAEMPRLRYLVQKLGDAEEAAIVAPGADGTGYAFLLRHRLGNWARFNWPVFEPVATCKSVTFRVRRGAAEPTAIVVRLLTDDGNEWQSPRLRVLEGSWREVELNAGDFTFFRGSRPDDSEGLDFSRVVQFQMVPQSTMREGVGVVHVDDIRFLPDGPGWRAADDELRSPPDPFHTEWERVDDLARRWQAERQRLTAERRRVDQ
ncbi:MAG: hypothetical protein U1E05_19150, partial [Patescibacteria group bacterium]|nr:hypothetical protein [Patescibacteria group bacterium]